jgi:hypothetical protein
MICAYQKAVSFESIEQRFACESHCKLSIGVVMARKILKQTTEQAETNKLHTCEINLDVNCAIPNDHPEKVCACRTMKPLPPPATLAVCGCTNLGADIRHLLQRETGNGDSAELQSQLGSGLCSISTVFLTSFLVPPFPLSLGARHLEWWRDLLPSAKPHVC